MSFSSLMSFEQFLVFMPAVILVIIFFEVRGYIRQRQYLNALEPIMHQWRGKHDLTDAEKNFLEGFIKFSFNPLSVFKLVFYIWILPFKQGKKSEVMETLKAKDKELFKQTTAILEKAFMSASPILHFIIFIEILIMLVGINLVIFILHIILSVNIVFVKCYKKGIHIDKQAVEKMNIYRKRLENTDSLESSILQKVC